MKLITAVLGAALLLSGCTASPAPAPAPPKSTEPLTGTGALGDFATVDFCSLLDERGVTGTGAATPPARTFDTCAVALSEKDIDTTVHIGSLSTDSQRAKDEVPYDYRGELPAGMLVEQSSADANSCVRYVVFADSVRIKVAASAGAKAGTAEARCAKADAAVKGVLAVAAEKRVGHVTFAANSFGKVDPCALLSGPQASEVLAWEDPPTPLNLTKHACRKAFVDVVFDIGSPAPPSKSSTTVTGKQFAKTKAGEVCTLRLERQAPDASGRVESVTLSAYLSAEDKKWARTARQHVDCGNAERVAEYLLPRLPV